MASTSPKTVFIIGAGASKEARLPIGSELKKLIAHALDIRFQHGYTMVSGDHVIVEALHAAVKGQDPPSQGINPYLHAGWRICAAMPQAISIDHFLDAHNGDKQVDLCGKLAIARTILRAEHASSLFVDPMGDLKQLDFDHLENTWLNSFFQLLMENCRVPDLEQRLASVALVIFNYDRCVEHFLYYALQNYYSIEESKVVSLLKRLEIYHPYGTVGSLPWQDSEAPMVEFGADPHGARLLACTGPLKTFTEGTDESSSDITAIRSIMNTAQRLVFLGFAFHRLNLDLLLPRTKSPKQNGRSIFATAYGLSASDVELITTELAARGSIINTAIKLRNDKTCVQLFQEFWRSLSFI